MAKLVYLMNVSLDGYIETPDHGLEWTNVDEELLAWFNDRTRDASAFLYGRRLYEVMAAYWPTPEADPAPPRRTPDVRIRRDLHGVRAGPRSALGRRHRQHVEAAVHVDHFAGDRPGKVAGEVHGRASDILDRDVRAERRDVRELAVH